MLKYIQKNRLCIVMILSSVIYFLFVYSVSAVELYFGSTNSEQSINNKFAVGFFVDTKGESINAVEGKVVFNSDELELVDIIDGESIINFWLNKPEAICNSICEVSFGGVIPGGFVGDKGNIFLLVLRSTKLGEVSISSIDSRILLNNGEGTMADLIISPINFKILEKTDTSEFVYPYDIDPPESFLPTIAQEEDIFDGKFFLAFATQDKLSGMDHYEVAESSKEVSDYNKLKWKIRESNRKTRSRHTNGR